MKRSQKLAAWAALFFIIAASLAHAVTEGTADLTATVIFMIASVIAFLFMAWASATARKETP